MIFQKRHLFLALLAVILLAVPTSATQLAITFNPAAGDEIKSEDFVNTWAEIEAVCNHIMHDNIEDSNVTWRELAEGAVNSKHLGAQSVTAHAIDSGAVSDTMLGFGISTSHFASNSDTINQWIKMANGFYIGNGDLIRPINNTYHTTNDTWGINIPFNITRVQIDGGGVPNNFAGTGLGNARVQAIYMDVFQTGDTYAFAGFATWTSNDGATPCYGGLTTDTDYIKRPTIVNYDDTHYFIVYGGGDPRSFNKNTEPYYWTAWGY